MPLIKTAYDDDGRLRRVHWSLPGELVDERAYVSQFTAEGIAPGFKHSCFTQVEFDVEDVYTRISDYFTKHEGDVAGVYFVTAAASGYIGLFFTDKEEQARFVLEMGAQKPDPDSAVHFVVNHKIYEQNILINQARVKERLPDVFAMNARPKQVRFELPEVPKPGELFVVEGGRSDLSLGVGPVNGAVNGATHNATHGVVGRVADSGAINGLLNNVAHGGAARAGAVRIGAVRMKGIAAVPK